MLEQFFRRIKYRWEHCYDPFPGEGEFIDVRIDGKLTRMKRSSFWGPDVEKCMILRRLRAVLFGYGPPWTFWGALWDWASSGLAVILGLIVCATCIITLSVIPQLVHHWVHSWGCWGG